MKLRNSSTTPTRRYAAKVEKGENAWRREWSSFMSGVNLKELRKGGGVALPKAADLEVAIVEKEEEEEEENKKYNNNNNNTNSEKMNDELSEGMTGMNFGYLFASPAERKAARLAKQREEEEKRRKQALQRKKSNDPLAHLSKHERALWEAKQRGLNIEGMTRKEIRQFLHLTISKEQQEAEKHQEEFKPHELMDEKLQWYQQGPHPIDLIAEKLVVRKAIKKGKQLGLRYNYLIPHASWLAKREQRRREGILVGLGRRYLFDDDGKMLDAFGAPVNITSEIDIVNNNQNNYNNQEKENNNEENSQREVIPSEHLETKTPSFIVPPVLTSKALVDPKEACNSFVRTVVRDRKVAEVIKKANITTSYISSSLVMGPSIGLEEKANNSLLNKDMNISPSNREITMRSKSQKLRGDAPVVHRVKKQEKRSRLASFEP